MTITIGAWVIPLFATVCLLACMFRPYERCGAYDCGQIFRLFWLIPIFAVWLLYFAILLWFTK